jgi:hypothetical protein
MAFAKTGTGYVEPNHLSGPRTGQVYAQLTPNSAINSLENGQFVKYDVTKGEINFTGSGEWMMVYCEVKTYKDQETAADVVAYEKGKTPIPRVVKTNVGDIYTTNEVADGTAAGDKLQPAATGLLTKAETPAAGVVTFEVVKETTLPDGRPGVKLVRIA